MGLIGYALIIGGVLALLGGVLEVRTRARMRRDGLRLVGTVQRHHAYRSRDTDSPGPTYAPVVRYQDERGQIREFESKVRTSVRRPSVGQQVPVIYLPGRPESARLDTAGRNALSLFLTFGIGTVLLAVALIMRP